MKILITEQQYRLIEEERKVLSISYSTFNNDWDLLQKFLSKRGNPPYKISGDLDLNDLGVKSTGNLISVEGGLDLRHSAIKSLGDLTSVGNYLDIQHSKIKSFGNLTFVGGNLHSYSSDIESLGNLTYVGGNLDIRNTPLSKKYSEEEIRKMVKVGENIYL